MTRFLIGTIPLIGHVSPALPIARELVNRGHEVCWYTGQAFQSTVEKTGARFAPILSWFDYSDLKNVPPSLMEQHEANQGVQRLKFDLKNFFIDPALGQAKDLSEILEEFPADVLIADSMFLGISWVAEQKQLPWAEFGSSKTSGKPCPSRAGRDRREIKGVQHPFNFHVIRVFHTEDVRM